MNKESPPHVMILFLCNTKYSKETGWAEDHVTRVDMEGKL